MPTTVSFHQRNTTFLGHSLGDAGESGDAPGKLVRFLLQRVGQRLCGSIVD